MLPNIGLYFFHFYLKKIGNMKNPDAWKISGESFWRMLENISGSLWNFNVPRNMTKVEIKKKKRKIVSETFWGFENFHYAW